MVSKVTRRAWVGISALCAIPSAPAALLMMLGLWTASAETYATVIEAPHLGELGALLLVAVNIPICGMLLFNLLQLAHDLKQLRLPAHRRLLTAALAFFVSLTLLAPCALVLLLHGGTRDLLIVSAGACTGIAGALLWRYRGSVTPSGTPGRAQARGIAESAPPLRHPQRTLRTMLGAPYAPASWRRRSIELALVCAVLAGAPLLVTIIGASRDSRSVSLALHTSELLSLLAATALCWVYPLSRALALFDPKRGALTELALLPGLGNGPQQRRRLYRVTLSVPSAGLAGLLIIAMGAAWLQNLPNSVYVRLVLQFALFPLATLPVLLGQIAQRRVTWKIWPVVLFPLSQIWAFTPMIWTLSPRALPAPLLRWMSTALLLGVIALIGLTLYLLRKLALRPHLFVDASS
jgi:hypothetical protein